MRPHPMLVHLAPLLLLATAGCSTQSGVPLGTVQMRLIDASAEGVRIGTAPSAIEAIRIVVTEVSIHPADDLTSTTAENGSSVGTGAVTTGWEVVRGDTTTHDLLALRGGTATTLAVALVPAGVYTQIRLKIGEGSNVVVDGVTHPLVIPSGIQSGLKLIHDFTVTPDGFVDIAIEFDATKSVSEVGDGTWHFQPTVRVTSTPGRGSPSGMAPRGAARPL